MVSSGELVLLRSIGGVVVVFKTLVGTVLAVEALPFVLARFSCCRLIPWSRTLSGSGELIRRPPKLNPLSPFGIGMADERLLLISTSVAFFGSDIGIREAVLCILAGVVAAAAGTDVMDGYDMLVGRGLEKLAGDGLCGRELKLPSRVKSVESAILLLEFPLAPVRSSELGQRRSDVVRAENDVCG
jgi:hypothetical protein